MNQLKMISAKMILDLKKEIIFFESPLFYKQQKICCYKKLLKKLKIKCKGDVIQTNVEIVIYSKRVLAISKGNETTDSFQWFKFNENIDKIDDLSNFVKKYY